MNNIPSCPFVENATSRFDYDRWTRWLDRVRHLIPDVSITGALLSNAYDYFKENRDIYQAAAFLKIDHEVKA